jgi:glycolate oxidase iron-sulfur subunit
LTQSTDLNLIGFTRDDPPSAAEILRCTHCGMCLNACPTYRVLGEEMDSPRGRIYLMRAAAEGRTELTPTLARHLDLCLGCRACETACPSGVPFGPIEATRGQLAAIPRASARWVERRFALFHPTGWADSSSHCAVPTSGLPCAGGPAACGRSPPADSNLLPDIPARNIPSSPRAGPRRGRRVLTRACSAICSPRQRGHGTTAGLAGYEVVAPAGRAAVAPRSHGRSMPSARGRRWPRISSTSL